MSDDGSITYASECAETESEEEDYVGEDEEVVAHQEEPEVCHKVCCCFSTSLLLDSLPMPLPHSHKQYLLVLLLPWLFPVSVPPALCVL